MMAIWLYTMASVMIVSLISMVGILTVFFGQKKRFDAVLLFMVSFSVGGLFGDAFIHLIPEAYRKLGPGSLHPSLLIISGIFIFFILEKFLCWRHCHIPTSDEHPHQLAVINIVGDAFHNLIDGIILGASYQISPAIGFSTTLAVILHEIPQEMGDYGVLLYSGMGRRKALLYNFLSASTAVFGAALSLLFGTRVHDLSASLLPFAAGGFIYLAGADLIPELRKENNPAKSLLQLVSILLGVGMMAALLLLE